MSKMQEILDIIGSIKPGVVIAPDAELVKTGVLDSVDIMTLVMALSEDMDVTISPVELKEENFHTPQSILALVNRLEDEQ